MRGKLPIGTLSRPKMECPAFLHLAVWPVQLSNIINCETHPKNQHASQYTHCHDHANYKLFNAHLKTIRSTNSYCTCAVINDKSVITLSRRVPPVS